MDTPTAPDTARVLPIRVEATELLLWKDPASQSVYHVLTGTPGRVISVDGNLSPAMANVLWATVLVTQQRDGEALTTLTLSFPLKVLLTQLKFVSLGT